MESIREGLEGGVCAFVKEVVSVPEGTEGPDGERVCFWRFVVGWWRGKGCMRCDVDL